MKFEMIRYDADRKTVFIGEYTDAELGGIAFNPLEAAVLRQPAESPADYLCNLELIYRRHEEQK